MKTMGFYGEPRSDQSADPDAADLTIVGGETADHTVPAELLDLSSMTFDQIALGSRRLIIDPPLAINPTMDEESGQLYVLSDEELGIHVYAQTRERLVDELAEQLIFQWDAYARESPDRLTAQARRLREALRARMREDGLATQPEGR